MRIWTYKNADEKVHTFSRRSKNVKKRTKTYEKRILCKFTFIFINPTFLVTMTHTIQGNLRSCRNGQFEFTLQLQVLLGDF